MKKILITGKGSYIGTNFKQFMTTYSDEYEVDELDMMNPEWKTYSFEKYDSVFHVAGIAHSTPDESQRELYYKVNTELAYETAKLAKETGVKQFIFMSSVIVYGSGIVGKEKIIESDTPLTPDNFYGDSKKQAELKLKTLEDKNFRLVIIRTPMIYGKNSKGNYTRLSKLARKTPIFPSVENKRSMLYIESLMLFVRLMIVNQETGIFHPQNEEYVSTRKLVEEIASVHGHKIRFINTFNPFIKLLKSRNTIDKLFGNFVIDKQLSFYKINYSVCSFKDSIKQTEKIGDTL